MLGDDADDDDDDDEAGWNMMLPAAGIFVLGSSDGDGRASNGMDGSERGKKDRGRMRLRVAPV